MQAVENVVATQALQPVAFDFSFPRGKPDRLNWLRKKASHAFVILSEAKNLSYFC